MKNMKKRPIRKIGNSWFIRLAPVDVKDYQIEEGDEIDIEPSLFLHIHPQVKKEKKQK